MIIQGREVDQITIVRNQRGTTPVKMLGLVTAESGREVIAVISDDDEIIVKDGYSVEFS